MSARSSFSRFVRLMAATLMTTAAAVAVAQQFPSKPVRLIVGFSPGGPIDSSARLVSGPLSQSLGQPFVVENRTGANGMLAAETVKNAPPDGHTLFVSSSSAITLNPTLLKKTIRYAPENDFVAVASIISMPLVLVVNASDPEMASIRTVADLVARAKAQPSGLTYGSAGNGNLTHLAFELFSHRAGIKMTHVPYRGTATAQTALLGREVAMVFDSMSAVQHIKAGRFRALAISSARRVDELPDVPTMQELGYGDFDMTSWVGVFAPKATPQEVVEKLSGQIVAAVQDGSIRDKLVAQGPLMPLSAAEFAAKVRKETAQLADVVTTANIVVE